ncbi:hypothetical protein OXX79_008759 [Metschnikowia pulcherrima]
MMKLSTPKALTMHLSKRALLARMSFRFKSTNFAEHTPSPPKLPKEQQEEFEKLQKLANSQAAIDEYNRQIREEGSTSSEISTASTGTDVGATAQYFKTIPEFEGDRNPVTGEVGGPKQEPLRHNDWSYNGRVTDF